MAGIPRRTIADLLLFGVTAVELALLAWLTPSFGFADWIYLTQHLVVLGVAMTRCAPLEQDRSLRSSAAVLVAYAYPYAQMVYLRWEPDEPVWPAGGVVLVTAAACLSLASLLTLGRRFGIRPARRDLTTVGPYRFVRHPMYLAYLMADVGYNLVGWNGGTVLLVLAGWTALVYRIRAEERMLAGDPGWTAYAARVRYRLLPGIW